MPSFALSIIHALADLVCPERCAACPTLVAGGAIFCHACSAHVNVLGPPECAGCGTPAPTAPCQGCAADPEGRIRHARAWAAYRVGRDREPVARALASFKYDGQRRLSRRLAWAMAARIADPAVSLIVPIPLHVRRLRARGFNQSALLARHIGRAVRVPVDFDVLARVRDTPSQTRANVRERRARVANAFATTRSDGLRQRSILLVDDVWTSGATARAAAATLRAAGAGPIDVITFARVDHTAGAVASLDDRN